MPKIGQKKKKPTKPKPSCVACGDTRLSSRGRPCPICKRKKPSG